jgi:hypothetical protein
MMARARAAGVVTVSAHTLGEENASTAVLRRSGFHVVAELPDDELGAVWRWSRPLGDDTDAVSGRAEA